MAKLSDLKPDPKNARKHNPRNVGLIVDALHEVGAARSIVVDEDGVILAGNATIEAAAEAGIEDVQFVDVDGETIIAVRRSGLTEEQKTRLALFDNRSAELAEWDADVLGELAGVDELLEGLWSVDEIDDFLGSHNGNGAAGADAEPLVDLADRLREKWGTETGQLWEIGDHRLLCGDATSRDDVERLLELNQIDLVWTDPPYGVAIGDKNKHLNAIGPANRVERNLENDTLDEQDLELLLVAAFDLAISHCRPGASWYVAAPPGPLHVVFGQVLKERGIWRQTIQWVKNNATFSPLGVDYHWQAEPIFYGWLPNGNHEFHGGRRQTTVWEIDRPLKSPEHPTMKPLELVRRAIKNSTKRDQVVYDPFIGSGTTMAAAEEVGRRCFGMEIDPSYTAVVLELMTDAGLQPVKGS